MYFNIQTTSFSENPTPHDYAGLHGIKELHLQSLGQLQLLFDPDLIVKSSFKTSQGTICLVRVLDNERSLKFILELSDKFWEEIE